MSYHRSLLPLGALGWPMPEMAGYGMADSDAILPNKPLCGSAMTVQAALRDQGFYKGPIDGQLGSGSVTAIRNFSIANGLGSKTWPDPAFCAKLKEKQNLALNAEYERRNPPPPEPSGGGGGGVPATGPIEVVDVTTPGSGGGGSSAAPAAQEDNTMIYVLGAVGVLAIAAGAYFATR